MWYCNLPLQDCKLIANLCLLLSNIQKGRLHYIHRVGRSVDVTINFPSPNNFLPFLLHSSSPPRTKCFPSSKYFPSINIFLLQIFCFFFCLRSFSPPRTKYFPPFHSPLFFSSLDKTYSFQNISFSFSLSVLFSTAGALVVITV